MINGDKNAFLAFYHKYYQVLFWYGFKLTADREFTKDCLQELFLEIWNTRSTLNPGVDNVASYLFTWLRRKMSRIQVKDAKNKLAEKSIEIAGDTVFSYEELLIAFQQTEERKEQLTRALGKLTRRELQIIQYRYFDNLTYEAIAAKTSLTTRSVYNVVHKAITRLRDVMTILL